MLTKTSNIAHIAVHMKIQQSVSQGRWVVSWLGTICVHTVTLWVQQVLGKGRGKITGRHCPIVFRIAFKWIARELADEFELIF